MWCESDLLALLSFQKRKRKEKEDDTVSLYSFDLKVSIMTAPSWLLHRRIVFSLEHVLAANFNPSV